MDRKSCNHLVWGQCEVCNKKHELTAEVQHVKAIKKSSVNK